MRIGIALLLCVLAPGCATQPDQARIERAASMLAQRTDADSLAAAAVLRAANHDAALALLVAATAREPDRADLQWLHLRACGEVPACDPVPVETKLRQLDPANAAGWLGPISRAVTAQRDEEVDALLASIAATERFDTYWSSLVPRLTEVTARSGAVSEPDALGLVIGMLAGTSIPPFRDVVAACNRERLERQGVRESCEALVTVLRNGDTYIAEMVGVSLVKRLWPEDSPEARSADEARLAHRYRSAVMLELTPEPMNAAASSEFLRHLRANHREQDAFRAQILAAGRDPDPPPGWRDESGERVAPASSNP